MRIQIHARTGNGQRSTEEEVQEATARLMDIAREIRGHIVDGKGFSDGAMVEIEE